MQTWQTLSFGKEVRRHILLSFLYHFIRQLSTDMHEYSLAGVSGRLLLAKGKLFNRGLIFLMRSRLAPNGIWTKTRSFRYHGEQNSLNDPKIRQALWVWNCILRSYWEYSTMKCKSSLLSTFTFGITVAAYLIEKYHICALLKLRWLSLSDSESKWSTRTFKLQEENAHLSEYT